MEDEKIIELYWQRKESAIRETSAKYSKYLWTIAYNILKNSEDSEECESDTYIAAWNTIPPTKPLSLCAYLAKIVRNVALDKFAYYKAAKRNKDIEVLFSELEDCLHPENAGQDGREKIKLQTSPVEEAWEAGELAKIIGEYLETVKKENRLIFVRRYYYADSVKELAEMTGNSEGKIKSLLFRMREQLRRYLEERGFWL